MTVSDKGTAQGRPDETWTYVVEVPKAGDKRPVPDWVSVHTTNDYAEAVRVAQEYEHVRVRSFKQAHIHADYGIHPSVFTSKRSTAPDVPLVTRLCASHPDQRVRVPETASPARCPTCHAIMVSVSMARAMGVKL